MEKSKLDRINELAKLSKQRQLTETEKTEQKSLREEYIEQWRRSVAEVLDNTFIVEINGEKRALKKKDT